MEKNEKRRFLVLFVLLIGLAGCKDANANRYGSMALLNDELYYYANDYVYKYASGACVEVEKADSPYFDVTETDGVVEISYRDSGEGYEETPYADLLDGAGQIVYNEEFVYARYPGGEGSITVYRVMESSDGTETLEPVDEIEF